MRVAYGMGFGEVISPTTLIPVFDYPDLRYFELVEGIDMNNCLILNGWGLAGRPEFSHVYLGAQLYGDSNAADDLVQTTGSGPYNNEASGQPTAYILRRNLDDTVAWFYRLGSAGGSTQITDVRMNADGDCFVAGVANTAFTFPDGWSNPGSFTTRYGWWAKIAANGTWLWTITSGVSSGTATSISVDTESQGVGPYILQSDHDGGCIIGCGGGLGANVLNLFGTNLTAHPTGDGTVTAAKFFLYRLDEDGAVLWRKNGSTAVTPSSYSIKAGYIEDDDEVWVVGNVVITSGSPFTWDNVSVAGHNVFPTDQTLFRLDPSTHTADNEMNIVVGSSAGSQNKNPARMFVDDDGDLWWVTLLHGSSGAGQNWTYQADPSGTAVENITVTTANANVPCMVRVNRSNGRFKMMQNLGNHTGNQTFLQPVLVEGQMRLIIAMNDISDSTKMTVRKFALDTSSNDSAQLSQSAGFLVDLNMCPRLGSAGKPEMLIMAVPHNNGAGTATFPDATTVVTTSTDNRIMLMRAR